MNKFFRFMSIGLIFCIVFVTGCSNGISPKLTNTIKTLKFEEIKSARIKLGTAGASPIKYVTFDFNNSDHTKVIKDVVHYLNSAKIQGNEYKQIVLDKGGSLPYLILTLKDSSVIDIEFAIHDTITKNPDGSTDQAKNLIPNEVTINIKNSNEKSIRILSPEIKKLIESINNSKDENQTIKATANKSENDIREIAYKSLNEHNKKTVISWKDGKVEQYKGTKDHSLGSSNGRVNIKGKDTYKVTFSTTNEGLLGPITIYIDKNNYNVLGGDYRF